MIARTLHVVSTALLLVVFPAAMQPQAAPQTPAPAAQPGQPATAQPASAPTPTNSERRRANRIYLNASKLYVNGQFEEALKAYQQAAQIDPTNNDYRLAGEVARSHLVTALVQSAARARLSGDEAAAKTALRRAVQVDPQNPAVTQHLYELSDEVAATETEPLYQRASAVAGESASLSTNPGRQSLHLYTDARQLIQQAFRAYGITALVTDNVPAMLIHFDLDDADFSTAMHVLSLATDTFYVPLDTHQVLVARDTRENRNQYARQDIETVYLYGLSSTELTDAANLAKNVYNVGQAAANAANSSLTLRGTPASLESFNAGMRDLMDGRSQVMLDVRIVQVGHISGRNTGVKPPQAITAFNAYAAEQAILNANQALVEQIISSGLAAPGDTLAILGILLASGQVSSSLFAGGVALFGGGITQSGLSPSGPATMNFSLNSSDSRALENIQLRLGDGESSTIKAGSKYPIQTSSYSNLGASLPNIPGLTGAGSSSGLSSLLSSLSGGASPIPMFQYQDIGLTLKVTPKVLRNGDVALSVELTLDGLSGSSLNGNPILSNQAFTGVVTLVEGESAEIASELDQSQSRAITGTPGISDVPGLNNILNKNVQTNYATLLIIMTPHVVRSTQPAGATRQMIVQKGLTAQ